MLNAQLKTTIVTAEEIDNEMMRWVPARYSFGDCDYLFIQSPGPKCFGNVFIKP